MSEGAISDYALLSDCHSAGLVGLNGSVDWLCFPRFDGPSVFGRLLDPAAGHFSIRPARQVVTTRSYVDRTMVIETRFTTESGRATLFDAMAVGENDRGHELGKHSPRVLLRRVICEDGEVEIIVDYSPRPEYGLIQPLLYQVDGGISARGGADLLMLSSSEVLEITGSSARGRIKLGAGGSASFALAHRHSWMPASEVWTEAMVQSRLEDTIQAWRTWSDIHQGYEGPWRGLVRHSGRVLQALTYAPTGAIVASATTSLPEQVGGVRNWDYRYSWVRDASFTIEALWVAACPDEAHEFFSYLAAASAAQLVSGGNLQIMFGVGGEHDLSERELSHLAGWRGSRPVRVGNDAWKQRQLDVYGELLNAAHRLADQLGDLPETTRRFLTAAADAAGARWNEPDQGIWEVRDEPQHFLYSKLMCWVALDRAISLASRLGAEDRLDQWEKAREAVRDAILQRGWSDRAQAFTQALGSDELDASALMMPIVGFIAPNDPRMLATLKAIQQGLTDDRGLVFRYTSRDGLPGEQGAFLLCTFWLAQALALADRVEEAREVFERAIRYVNDVDLLAEEVDPATGELLGNFPQAFSHIGLINAAWAITEAEKRIRPSPQPH
jgi:GH15 family glucan-1,4-alpha-glucosidase